MQSKSRKIVVLSVALLCVLAPLVSVLSVKLFQNGSYYIAAAAILLLSMMPFFVFFENRKIKTGEIVTVAGMIALCVASRAALAFAPQVKPTCALVIVTAIAFGPNVGFFVGSMSMFLSNFLFGQGMFTPFQMLGMGLVGFVCGLLFHKKPYGNRKLLVAVAGGTACLLIYGFTVDSCSVLMMSTALSLQSAAKIFLTGLPFNLIHGLTTAILLFLINKPMTDKFNRLRIKYGIFAME